MNNIMKLFKLHRDCQYNSNDGYVIYAEDESDARRIADEDEPVADYGFKQHPWLDKTTSTCNEVDVVKGIILESYCAG